jgi:hypothetical protein
MQGEVRRCAAARARQLECVAVKSNVMYSAIVLCCLCCALNKAAAGSIYMTYL